MPRQLQLTALALMGLTGLFGWSLLSLAGLRFAWLPKVAMGIAVGSGLFTAVVLGAADLRGSLDLVSIGAGVVLAIVVSVAGLRRRQAAPPLPGCRLLWPVLSCLGVLFWVIFWHQFMWKDGRLYADGIASQTDGSMHLGLIHSFAYSDNFPPQQPLCFGHPLDYHFLCDLLSAILLRCGSSLTAAVAWPSVLLLMAAAVLVYAVSLELGASPVAGCLAVILLFFSGGLGFVHFFHDLARQGLGALWFPPHEYTVDRAHDLYLTNFVTGLLVPQRAYQMGLPLFLTAYLCLRKGSVLHQARYFLGAAAVAGLLTWAHIPSLAVLVFISPALAVLDIASSDDRSRSIRLWLLFTLATGALTAPRLLLLLCSREVLGNLRLQAGWLCSRYGHSNVMAFWWNNAGVFLVLTALAPWLLDGAARRRWRRDYLPFASLFLLANVVNLQENAWDNGKFLYYWYLFSCPYVAGLLVRLARGAPWRRLVAGLLALSLVLSGALDLWRLCRYPRNQALMVGREGAALARFVLGHTPPRARFLISPQQFDHPLPMLTGRAVFLGYPRWLRSYGLTVAHRRGWCRTIVRGGPLSRRLLGLYGIDYVVLESSAPAVARLKQELQLVYENQSYAVLEARPRTRTERGAVYSQ